MIGIEVCQTQVTDLAVLLQVHQMIYGLVVVRVVVVPPVELQQVQSIALHPLQTSVNRISGHFAGDWLGSRDPLRKELALSAYTAKLFALTKCPHIVFSRTVYVC